MNIIKQVGIDFADRAGDAMYPNKTRKYLLPCLRDHGESFLLRINSVYKIAIGIGDNVVTKCGIHYDKHLFVLLSTTQCDQFFRDFIEWIKDQPMYENDYVYGNIMKSDQHMLVVRFPEHFMTAFNTFKEGKYSEMYDGETIERLFNRYSSVRSVLFKDIVYAPIFVDDVNKLYGTTVKVEEWAGELDFPPTAQTEVFNYYL